MAKETKQFTSAELRHIAKGLRLVATRIEQVADVLDAEAMHHLDIAAWKSGDLGVKNFVAFAKSAHEALDATLLRAPVQQAPVSAKQKKKGS